MKRSISLDLKSTSQRYHPACLTLMELVRLQNQRSDRVFIYLAWSRSGSQSYSGLYSENVSWSQMEGYKVSCMRATQVSGEQPNVSKYICRWQPHVTVSKRWTWLPEVRVTPVRAPPSQSSFSSSAFYLVCGTGPHCPFCTRPLWCSQTCSAAAASLCCSQYWPFCWDIKHFGLGWVTINQQPCQSDGFC